MRRSPPKFFAAEEILQSAGCLDEADMETQSRVQKIRARFKHIRTGWRVRPSRRDPGRVLAPKRKKAIRPSGNRTPGQRAAVVSGMLLLTTAGGVVWTSLRAPLSTAAAMTIRVNHEGQRRAEPEAQFFPGTAPGVQGAPQRARAIAVVASAQAIRTPARLKPTPEVLPASRALHPSAPPAPGVARTEEAAAMIAGTPGTGNDILNVAFNRDSNPETIYFGSLEEDQKTISEAGTSALAVVSVLTSSPPGASVTVTGIGCIPGTYTTPAGLTWDAHTNCTVNFTTPQVIGGTQYVFDSATVNNRSPMSNPLRVSASSTALTVNADFKPCTYSLVSSGQTFDAAAGLGSFTVNTAPACSWNAVASASWITIPPGAFHGTASVNYSIAANSGGARAGTISVGGQQYHIDQAALTCIYSVGPGWSCF